MNVDQKLFSQKTQTGQKVALPSRLSLLSLVAVLNRCVLDEGDKKEENFRPVLIIRMAI